MKLTVDSEKVSPLFVNTQMLSLNEAVASGVIVKRKQIIEWLLIWLHLET